MKSGATRSYHAIFLVFLLFIPFGTASAQQKPKPSGQSSLTDSERQAGGNFNNSFASDEFGLGGRIVQGAPFSAVAISETTQNLSDGRTFVRRRVASLYRNSQGNMRAEWGNDAKAKGVVQAPIFFEVTTGAL